MKRTVWCYWPEFPGVAPHAGAWIETPSCPPGTTKRSVAPHAGAWIETGYRGYRRWRTIVAPHAGAWIETRPAARPL